jgi:tripartite-type tricarboxylate transporter receptor subunit TctC
MMRINKNFAALTLVAGIASLGGVSTAAAADYPSQAIRVIVPFAPGGSTDIVARIVTQGMSEALGQPMVVENKGGAGGAIGAAEAARAKPDGYTLSIATVSTMAVNAACRPKDLPYDPLKDFMPVTNFANVPNVIEVNPKFPAKTFKEFVKALKDNPGKYTHGSSGTCSVLHLFGEAFKQSTDTDAIHVPYKGRSGRPDRQHVRQPAVLHGPDPGRQPAPAGHRMARAPEVASRRSHAG